MSKDLFALFTPPENPDEVADQLTALCQMMALIIGNYIKPDRIDEVSEDLMEQITNSAHAICRDKKGAH